MSDKIFSLLHISDFHFSKRGAREQEIVVDALVQDLETICIGHRRPDLIVFTGDLVNAAGVDSHFDAYDFFVEPVAKAAGCSEERVFIVPGNHDAARSVVKENAELHREWQSTLSDMGTFNKAFESGSFAETYKNKFDGFRELEQYLNGNAPLMQNEFVTIHRIDAMNVDLVILNTALLTATGEKGFEHDLGRLGVPEYAVLDAIKKLTPGSFRIVATHHPLSWLTETSAKQVRSIIQQEGSMHLFGHMHEPLSANITSFEGDLYSSQAGAIFAGRDRYIGYSLISIEPEKRLYETHLRSYYKDRREFDAAIDVVSEGKFYSSQKARDFWRSIASPVDDQHFRNHLFEACLPALAKEPDQEGIGDRKLHDMFVPAPMRRNHLQPHKENEPETTVEQPVRFDDLVRAEGSCIIYAAPEYGRTTVLKELQYQLLSQAKDVPFARLPVVIDFADIAHNAGKMLRLLRSRIVGPDGGFDFESLLKLGHVCVLVDDIVFEDRKRMAILRAFVTEYPKARYILTTLKTSVVPYGASIDPEMPVTFDLIELCPFRRRDMRVLVTKWNSCTDVESVLDRIQSEIGEINLPFTAANGTILMVILEEQSGFRPVNRWVLIEQFVEVTLKKAAIEQSKRETFDYHNKTALLASIAGWMTKENRYLVDLEELRSVIKAYVDRIEVTVDVTALLDEFLLSRLFIIKSENRICFRYRAVLEYFIALNMKRDAEFKAWVLDEARYLSFVNEIQYFAGAVRDDAALVDLMSDRFNAILKETIDTMGGADLDRIAALELPAKDNGTVEHLSEQLSDQPLTEEERDEELGAEIAKDAEERQEVFRPNIDDLGNKFLTALLLYSGLIKNMEEIAGSEKRKHLALAWRGWGAFLHSSLQIVPELARERKIRINGVLYELHVPLGMSDGELARRISLGMPVSMSRLILASLGTEKLEQQLVEPELAADPEPLIIEYMRAALVADLKLSAVVATLKTALVKLRSSRYLSESFVQKIAELRRYERISDDRFQKIAPTVAESIAALGGATGKQLASEKRTQMTRLRRQGLLLHIKRQKEGD